MDLYLLACHTPYTAFAIALATTLATALATTTATATATVTTTATITATVVVERHRFYDAKYITLYY